jgi:RNA polymerase sigma factor (TIGR02999 family)
VLSPDQPLTVLLRAWREGDPDALERLMPLVYEQIRQVAAAYLRRERAAQSLATGDLVAEAFLKLAGDGGQPDWQDRAHFFGIAARVMRQVLVDHARRRAAGKRGSGERAVTLDENLAVGGDPEELIALDRALAVLAADDERKARVIELVYFAGMSQPEIAEVLGVHVNTVAREQKLAQAWLARLLDEKR